MITADSLRIVRCLLGAASLLCLTDCATSQQSSGLPPVPPPPSEGTRYGLRAGDLLTVSFSGEPDLIQQVRVDWNGMVNVPPVAADGRAEFKAAGLSPSELAARINATAKENRMLVNAKAQVLVSEYSNQAFSVLGQVAQPGRYSFPRGLPPRLNIEEAVALAGGCTRLARQSHVLLKRDQNVYVIDLEDLASKPGHPPVIIVPGDIITVGERRF